MNFIPMGEWGVFPDARPALIAGPCSAETESQVMQTATELRSAGVGVFRAGIWKPRTHPGCFEGIGLEGLPWLGRVKRELGMKVCTEVAGARHVQACLDACVDMVWIGARTTANPFLVQEIAESLRGTDIPVLVKNPVNPDLDLWVGALERLARQGVRKVGVIHRGFSSFDNIRYRNNPQWQVAIELRSRFPRLPFFCDPSHMAGDRAYVSEIAQRAMDLGLDGLMIESHCNPACALSDNRQQLTPDALASLMRNLTVREQGVSDTDFNTRLEHIRSRIDVLDDRLLDAVAERMEASREIGALKRDNNVAIIQALRWEEVVKKAAASASERGLDREFVEKLFGIIHEASINEQNKILQK